MNGDEISHVEKLFDEKIKGLQGQIKNLKDQNEKEHAEIKEIIKELTNGVYELAKFKAQVLLLASVISVFGGGLAAIVVKELLNK